MRWSSYKCIFYPEVDIYIRHLTTEATKAFNHSLMAYSLFAWCAIQSRRLRPNYFQQISYQTVRSCLIWSERRIENCICTLSPHHNISKWNDTGIFMVCVSQKYTRRNHTNVFTGSSSQQHLWGIFDANSHKNVYIQPSIWSVLFWGGIYDE